MDDVHAMTFMRKFPRVAKPIEPVGLSVLRSHRMKLRSAERFVIDDDVTRLVCRLSHEQRELESYAVLSRLPFDVMWIEYDHHVKVAEIHKLGVLSEHRQGEKLDYKEIPGRVGFLMYRDGGDTTTRWICHSFSWIDEYQLVVPGLVAVVFDPDGAAHGSRSGI
jgi:hypothetical protein